MKTNRPIMLSLIPIVLSVVYFSWKGEFDYVIGLIVVCTLFWQLFLSFSSAFTSESGKIEAQVQNLASLVEQAKQLTRVQETEKAEIARNDWNKREVKIFYRKKLEEFGETLYQVELDATKMVRSLSQEDSNFNPLEYIAINKLRMLSTFYFLELSESVDLMYIEHVNLSIKVQEVCNAITNYRYQISVLDKALKAHVDQDEVKKIHAEVTKLNIDLIDYRERKQNEVFDNFRVIVLSLQKIRKLAIVQIGKSFEV